MSPSDVLAAVRASRLVAILRASCPEHLLPGARALVDEGVQVLEFPLTTPGALEALEAAVVEFGGRALVGAGTVRNRGDACRALDAGAQFLVTPTLSVPVIEEGLARGVAVLPGAFSPTEVVAAVDAGATMVKLFPAVVVGPEYLRQLRAPLPDIQIIPTGGIDVSDAQGWLEAGALALGIGSPLTGNALETGDLDGLRRRARAWKGALA